MTPNHCCATNICSKCVICPIRYSGSKQPLTSCFCLKRNLNCRVDVCVIQSVNILSACCFNIRQDFVNFGKSLAIILDDSFHECGVGKICDVIVPFIMAHDVCRLNCFSNKRNPETEFLILIVHFRIRKWQTIFIKKVNRFCFSACEMFVVYPVTCCLRPIRTKKCCLCSQIVFEKCGEFCFSFCQILCFDVFFFVENINRILNTQNRLFCFFAHLNFD